MKLAPIDIANKTFTRKMMGLDAHEVYNFLRDMADEMEEVVRERDRLKEELRSNKGTLTDFEERDESLKATLQAAAKMSEHFRQDAEREAKLILEDARQRADVMVRDARDSLRRIYQEIADLKKTRMQFETGMKSLMEAHLTMLDQGRKVFPDPTTPEDEPPKASKKPVVDDEAFEEEADLMQPTVIGQA